MGMDRLKEIVGRYLDYNKMKLVKGDSGMDVLIPFLLMDLQYSIWQEEIKGVECRHKMKMARSRWKEAYGLFTRSFFAAFSEEQVDAIVDLMDEYEQWMESAVMNARVAVMNEIAEREFEEQKLLSACLMCNCLSQCAQIIWRTIHLDARGRGVENPWIEKVCRESKAFADAYMEQRGDRSVINLNGRPKVEAAMNALTRRLAQFLHERKPNEDES